MSREEGQSLQTATLRLSLSWKVFLLAALNLVLVGLVFFVFMRVQFRLDVPSFLLSPAQDRILAASRQLALDLRETEPAGWDQLLGSFAATHNVEAALFDPRGAQLAGPEIPLSLPYREAPGRGRHGPEWHDEAELFSLGTTSNPTRHWIGIQIPLGGGGFRSRPGVLVVASTSWSGSMFFFDPRPWLAIGGAVLLATVLCWLPLVRGLTRSVSHMTRATAQIAEGQFEVHLPVEREDEIGQLSASINRMAARLEGFVKGQKRFLGDTAHELCSPIARIQVALGILERSAAPEQQGTVADLRDDAEHMSALVNELLSFSKAGMVPAKVRLEPVNLASSVARVLGREAAEGVQFAASVPGNIQVLAEPDLLSRALSNIVRNAVRYAGKSGPIEVTAAAENGMVALRILDSGPGLPEQDLDAVFDPFYRPSEARERETGGVGLGLAIVRTCVTACQGAVQCRNRKPTGLEVEIRLKAA